MMDQPTNDRPDARRDNKAGVFIMMGILIILIVVIGIGQHIETNRIMKSGVFVIGKITGWSNNRGVSVFYTYEFAGHQYHEQGGVDLKRESIGSFYLVRINPKTPTESILLKDFCLSDSVRLKQPDSGWRENPMDEGR